ncbi:GroES-like protein [Trichoderma citrinoviride]|uniref:GroES-like protein n=1 Tax=Trichoderma citrinoviride TaxID=58853 RepID=A0A2T4BJX2_9HYPO|nr:GroES-like protein [Trichoderma citrinoviride]PTB69606.1 GroES-like protein [Trichoderma citrinoviride]
MPSFTVYTGSKSGHVKPGTTTKPDLTGDQVFLRVTASGMCYTDVHYKHTDNALGHEGVGIIEEVGPCAKWLKKGDRVGWGYLTDSCCHCLECLQGQDIFCKERAIYGSGNTDQGSFSSHAVMRESFLHPIPDGMSDEIAAPLQCAGATVFTALHDVDSVDTVGIMGVGGLGHIAIQFAAKLGCRVVVLSGSDRKKEDASKLGAHRFVAMNSDNVQEQLGDWEISRLLVTTSAQPSWEKILPLLSTRARIYPLSVSEDNFEMPYMPIIMSGITIHGSLVATRAIHRKMLEFAAFHKITPVIERFDMTEEGINKAFESLEAGKVHYRAVLLPTKQ